MSVQKCTLLRTSRNSNWSKTLLLLLCELISVQILSCAHTHFENAQLHSGCHLTVPHCVHAWRHLEVSGRPAQDGPGIQQPHTNPGVWDKSYSDNADT